MPDLRTIVDACAKGNTSVRDVQRALSRGADINANRKGRGTALNAAVQGRSTELTRMLLQHGADPTIPDAKGVAPLHTAAFNGDGDIIKALLDHRADINVRDRHGQTPMFFVPDSRTCKQLIEARADVNVLNSKGQSSLHFAAYGGLADAMEMLAEVAEPELINAQDKHGRTAYYCAAKAQASVQAANTSGGEESGVNPAANPAAVSAAARILQEAGADTTIMKPITIRKTEQPRKRRDHPDGPAVSSITEKKLKEAVERSRAKLRSADDVATEDPLSPNMSRANLPPELPNKKNQATEKRPHFGPSVMEEAPPIPTPSLPAAESAMALDIKEALPKMADVATEPAAAPPPAEGAPAPATSPTREELFPLAEGAPLYSAVGLGAEPLRESSGPEIDGPAPSVLKVSPPALAPAEPVAPAPATSALYAPTLPAGEPSAPASTGEVSLTAPALPPDEPSAPTPIEEAPGEEAALAPVRVPTPTAVEPVAPASIETAPPAPVEPPTPTAGEPMAPSPIEEAPLVLVQAPALTLGESVARMPDESVLPTPTDAPPVRPPLTQPSTGGDPAAFAPAERASLEKSVARGLAESGTAREAAYAEEHKDDGAPTALERSLSRKAPDLRAIVEAAAKGRASVKDVKTALSRVKDVNANRKGRGTALNAAVQGRSTELTRMLLEHGADTTITDAKGVAPLHTAAFNGDGDIIEALLEHGADVNVRDRHGQTPMFFVPDSRTCKQLIEAKADVNVMNNKGQSSLHFAAYGGLADAMEMLAEVAEPELVNAQDRHGRTAYYCAAKAQLKGPAGNTSGGEESGGNFATMSAAARILQEAGADTTIMKPIRKTEQAKKRRDDPAGLAASSITEEKLKEAFERSETKHHSADTAATEDTSAPQMSRANLATGSPNRKDQAIEKRLQFELPVMEEPPPIPTPSLPVAESAMALDNEEAVPKMAAVATEPVAAPPPAEGAPALGTSPTREELLPPAEGAPLDAVPLRESNEVEIDGSAPVFSTVSPPALAPAEPVAHTPATEALFAPTLPAGEPCAPASTGEVSLIAPALPPDEPSAPTPIEEAPGEEAALAPVHVPTPTAVEAVAPASTEMAPPTPTAGEPMAPSPAEEAPLDLVQAPTWTACEPLALLPIEEAPLDLVSVPASEVGEFAGPSPVEEAHGDGAQAGDPIMLREEVANCETAALPAYGGWVLKDGASKPASEGAATPRHVAAGKVESTPASVVADEAIPMMRDGASMPASEAAATPRHEAQDEVEMAPASVIVDEATPMMRDGASKPASEAVATPRHEAADEVEMTPASAIADEVQKQPVPQASSLQPEAVATLAEARAEVHFVEQAHSEALSDLSAGVQTAPADPQVGVVVPDAIDIDEQLAQPVDPAHMASKEASSASQAEDDASMEDLGAKEAAEPRAEEVKGTDIIEITYETLPFAEVEAAGSAFLVQEYHEVMRGNGVPDEVIDAVDISFRAGSTIASIAGSIGVIDELRRCPLAQLHFRGHAPKVTKGMGMQAAKAGTAAAAPAATAESSASSPEEPTPPAAASAAPAAPGELPEIRPEEEAVDEVAAASAEGKDPSPTASDERFAVPSKEMSDAATPKKDDPSELDEEPEAAAPRDNYLDTEPPPQPPEEQVEAEQNKGVAMEEPAAGHTQDDIEDRFAEFMQSADVEPQCDGGTFVADAISDPDAAQTAISTPKSERAPAELEEGMPRDATNAEEHKDDDAPTAMEVHGDAVQAGNQDLLREEVAACDTAAHPTGGDPAPVEDVVADVGATDAADTSIMKPTRDDPDGLAASSITEDTLPVMEEPPPIPTPSLPVAESAMAPDNEEAVPKMAPTPAESVPLLSADASGEEVAAYDAAADPAGEDSAAGESNEGTVLVAPLAESGSATPSAADDGSICFPFERCVPVAHHSLLRLLRDSAPEGDGDRAPAADCSPLQEVAPKSEEGSYVPEASKLESTEKEMSEAATPKKDDAPELDEEPEAAAPKDNYLDTEPAPQPPEEQVEVEQEKGVAMAEPAAGQTQDEIEDWYAELMQSEDVDPPRDGGAFVADAISNPDAAQTAISTPKSEKALALAGTWNVSAIVEPDEYDRLSPCHIIRSVELELSGQAPSKPPDPCSASSGAIDLDRTLWPPGESIANAKADEFGVLSWELHLEKVSANDKFGFTHLNGKGEFSKSQRPLLSPAKAATNASQAQLPEVDGALEGPDCLIIKKLSLGGLLDRWNTRNPHLEVKVGDHITSVNGHTDIRSMQEELRRDVVYISMQRYPAQFSVTLERQGAQKFGFKFCKVPLTSGDSPHLKITSVVRDEGMVLGRWNLSCVANGRHDRVVTPGMRVVSVNGIVDDEQLMAKELYKDGEVELEITRGVTVLPTTATKVTAVATIELAIRKRSPSCSSSEASETSTPRGANAVLNQTLRSEEDLTATGVSKDSLYVAIYEFNPQVSDLVGPASAKFLPLRSGQVLELNPDLDKNDTKWLPAKILRPPYDEGLVPRSHVAKLEELKEFCRIRAEKEASASL